MNASLKRKILKRRSKILAAKNSIAGLVPSEASKILGFDVREQPSVYRFAQKHGMRSGRFETKYPWKLMNWDLSNEDLSRIWKPNANWVGAMRAQQGQVEPRWLFKDTGSLDDEYFRALSAEKEKARLHARSNRYKRAEPDRSTARLHG